MFSLYASECLPLSFCVVATSGMVGIRKFRENYWFPDAGRKSLAVTGDDLHLAACKEWLTLKASPIGISMPVLAALSWCGPWRVP